MYAYYLCCFINAACSSLAELLLGVVKNNTEINYYLADYFYIFQVFCVTYLILLMYILSIHKASEVVIGLITIILNSYVK
jgi:hypothetical protein